jgi:hypothetical protein
MSKDAVLDCREGMFDCASPQPHRMPLHSRLHPIQSVSHKKDAPHPQSNLLIFSSGNHL